MKIVVSNFGKQYSHDLLAGLVEKGWLGVFFTTLASNKFTFPWLPKRLNNALRKRAFPLVPAEKIRHYPALFALERLVRNRSGRAGRLAGDFFDRIVAAKLSRYAPGMVITYENTNRTTLREARRLGITTVLDLAQIHHDDIAEYGRWFMTPQQLEEEIEVVNVRKSEALQHTDYVLALSSFAANSMLRRGWPAERLFTLNLGIDPRRFTAKPQYRKNGPLRLLFVGTITRRKGLSILFEALRGLPEQALELTIIGPMADGHDILNANPGRFHYFPFLHHETLVQHYQQADVFVFPSLLDSWAQTVLEAMACGTPAIVTENTGSKDAVQQGGGWVIPANDPAALQVCLRFCLENRDAVEIAGREAHRIAQNYTWAAYHKNLIRVLEEIENRQNAQRVNH